MLATHGLPCLICQASALPPCIYGNEAVSPPLIPPFCPVTNSGCCTTYSSLCVCLQLAEPSKSMHDPASLVTNGMHAEFQQLRRPGRFWRGLAIGSSCCPASLSLYSCCSQHAWRPAMTSHCLFSSWAMASLKKVSPEALLSDTSLGVMRHPQFICINIVAATYHRLSALLSVTAALVKKVLWSCRGHEALKLIDVKETHTSMMRLKVQSTK